MLNGLIDAYSIKARLFPALVGVTPAIAMALFTVPWGKEGLPQVVAVGGVGILFCVFADLARRFGKRIERKIFRETGGKPSLTLLRHGSKLDAKTRQKYLVFLEGRLGEKGPTAEEEAADPKAAYAFYERCAAWIRERTRDHSKYKILFDENITYGSRRNLLGLKWPVMCLNAAVVAACIWFLATGTATPMPFYLVLGVAAIHGAYFLLAVTLSSVMEASDQYERQLLLCCETLGMDKAPPAVTPAPATTTRRPRRPKPDAKDSETPKEPRGAEG